jgi:hypothetical protein
LPKIKNTDRACLTGRSIDAGIKNNRIIHTNRVDMNIIPAHPSLLQQAHLAQPEIIRSSPASPRAGADLLDGIYIAWR